jgi:AcrR family transcriptional regulator
MSDGARREEILATAAELFASSGARTSLKEIAAACGILPGSLYHHFESKEAIVVELVQRYQADLDRLAAEALVAHRRPDALPFERQVIEFGRAIAACAVRHRAALLLTLYEPSANAGDELSRLANQTPHGIRRAMHTLLCAGQERGALRSDVDAAQLADRLCQSMLHHAVGDSHLVPGADEIPEIRCRLLLEGLAAHPLRYAELDASDALRVARELIDTWEDDGDDDSRVAHIRSTAREVFGRRGYESTTVRDIAAAADISIASIYRSFRSKEELLAAVMRSYTDKRRSAWATVLASVSTPLEQIDALTWVSIVLLDRFSDEYRIQLAWLRETPPAFHAYGSTEGQRRNIESLLASGARAGDVAFPYGTADARARCVYAALWTPDTIVRAVGTDGAHRLARQTLLEGALIRV